MKISVVIPVYNERKNVSILHEKIKNVMERHKYSYEVIFVDDGSTDGTFEELSKLKKIKVIKFRKNFGQTAAWAAGFKEAKGEVIVTIDGDLQNDPEDIPRLLDKMKEGYDVVSGWRMKRQDSIAKLIFSRMSNSIRRKFVKDPIHDSGCSLKAYKKECFDDIDLYGEMHRYIVAILNWKGFKIGEVKVRHYPRKHGKTKYGLWRLTRGAMDLINVWFWKKYSGRPLHMFGGIGIILNVLGILLGISLLIARQLFGYSLGQSQLPLLAVLLTVIGIQFFISGLMADIAVKNYYSFNERKPYSIEKIVTR